MLNIGRMAPGGEGYYLSSVADGLEDYYLGNGEAPGRWLGAGAAALGLSGTVKAEQLSPILEGLDPDGQPLLGQNQRRIPGFDLTFRAPTSVSMLYGLGDTATNVTSTSGGQHSAQDDAPTLNSPPIDASLGATLCLVACRAYPGRQDTFRLTTKLQPSTLTDRPVGHEFFRSRPLTAPMGGEFLGEPETEMSLSDAAVEVGEV